MGRVKSIILIMVAAYLLAAGMVASGQEDPAPAVRFAIIGDRTGGHTPGVYGEVLDEILRLRPEFIMTSGDMIEGYTDKTDVLDSEWTEYKAIIGRSKVPVHYTVGNHDIQSDIQEATFKAQMGEPNYSFNYKNIHITVLDNSRWDYIENFPQANIDWLTADLQSHENAPVKIVFMHKPFWYDGVAVSKPDPLHEIFVEHGVDAVFCGHFHEYFTARYDGVMYTTIGSSGGDMGNQGFMGYHFCWVTVDGEGIHPVPIDKGAVKPWDQLSADELRLATKLNKFGIELDRVTLNKDLTLPETAFSLTLHNFNESQAQDDTIRWNFAAGWTVEPATLPINIAPGATGTFEFRAACDGDLYPVPDAEIGLTYAADKKESGKARMIVSRQVDCPASSKIKIDGKLDEAIWKNPATQFFAPNGAATICEPVAFYFAHDDKYLYLAAKCTETKMDSLFADAKEHDGEVYGEDCVGLFFQPDMAIDTFYQVYINPRGTVFDQMIWMDPYGFGTSDRAWNGRYNVKTDRGKDFWTVEAAIELGSMATLRGPLKDKCAVNFRRKQKRFGSASDWMAPIDYDPKTFGVMNIK